MKIGVHKIHKMHWGDGLKGGIDKLLNRLIGKGGRGNAARPPIETVNGPKKNG